MNNVSLLNNVTGIAFTAPGMVGSFGNNRNSGNTTPGAPNLVLTAQ